MTSVKATERFSVYWNYQVWPLVEGQQVDGELADYLLATGSPVVELSAEPAVDVDGDGVPDGTAAQVLAWVDSDPDRAALALAAEQHRQPPRSTVVAALEKLIPPVPEPVADPAPAEPTE
jgi:hypothetical protein